MKGKEHVLLIIAIGLRKNKIKVVQKKIIEIRNCRWIRRGPSMVIVGG